MAPKGSKGQSFGEALQKMLSDIAQLSVLPDADIQFVSALQQAVTDKIRSSISQPPTPGAPGQGAPPTGAMPAGANPGMGGLSATGGAPGGMPPGGPADMGGASGSVPNMDEMNRMLGSNSQVS